MIRGQVTKVLARVTPAMDRPRGPDVQMTLRVPPAWIREGATVEVTLPRNLACAVCQGGGCDACERAGALSLRDRKEPAEVLEVTLPKRVPHTTEAASSQAIVVRIPDRGGFAEEGAELPRGNLLLSVRAGDQPGPGVSRLDPPAPRAQARTSDRPRRPSLVPLGSRPLSPPAAFFVGGLIAVTVWLLWRGVHAILP